MPAAQRVVVGRLWGQERRTGSRSCDGGGVVGRASVTVCVTYYVTLAVERPQLGWDWGNPLKSEITGCGGLCIGPAAKMPGRFLISCSKAQRLQDVCEELAAASKLLN